MQRIIIILILLFMIIRFQSYSQYYWPWEEISDERNNIEEVFCVNDILYGYNNYEVFYSTNHGKRWHLLEDFWPVIIGEISISNENIIYCYLETSLPAQMAVGTIEAGFDTAYECSGLDYYSKYLVIVDDLMFITHGSKVAKSYDYGANWENSSNGLPSGFTSYCNQSAHLYSLYTDGNRLYAGTNCYGIYRSDNYGASWYEINEGIPMEFKTSVHFTISNDVKLFTSTSKGVFYSENLGLNWVKENALPTDPSPDPIHLYSENLIYLDEDAIYTSQNNGQTWNSFSYDENFNEFISSNIIAADSSSFYISNGQYCYGASKLISSSTTIQASSYGLSHNNALFLFKKDSLLVSSTSNGGLYRSYNLGEIWQVSDNYLAGIIINSIIEFNSHLIAATDEGIYFSSDTGSTWNLNDSSLYFFNADNLLNYLEKVYCTMNGQVYYLSDDLVSWIIINSGIGDLEVNYLYSSEEFIYACTGEGVYFLDTINEVWIQLNSFPETNVSSIAINFNNIYLAGGNNIYHSWNDGSDWLLYQFDWDVEINYLAFAYDSILVGTNEGLYRRNYNSWELSTLDIDTRHILVEDTVTYASTINGVYKIYNSDIISSVKPASILENIDVYPNPAFDKLYIDCNEKIVVEFYSLSGELLFISNKNHIDISKLAQSFYIIRIKNENGELISIKTFNKILAK